VGSIGKWTGERHSKSIGKWTGEQCSIDKWIGGHQESSVKEQSVQSTSGSVNVSSSDCKSRSEGKDGLEGKGSIKSVKSKAT
jgi:hypothetical protein